MTLKYKRIWSILTIEIIFIGKYYKVFRNLAIYEKNIKKYKTTCQYMWFGYTWFKSILKRSPVVWWWSDRKLYRQDWKLVYINKT